MRGEHVGTTSRLIATSGKSRICPLVAPENQGFEKMRKFPRGKRHRHFFGGYIAYVRRQDAS
jgi:hypothetical protein